MTAGDWILLGFLGSNAWQDLRKKEILLFPTFVYGLLYLFRFLMKGGMAVELFASCLPGSLILCLALCSRGRIGIGDGWILLAVGIQRGFFDTLWILWAASLMMMAVSILLLAGERAGKICLTDRSLPVVPFLFLAALVCCCF